MLFYRRSGAARCAVDSEAGGPRFEPQPRLAFFISVFEIWKDERASLKANLERVRLEGYKSKCGALRFRRIA